MTIDQDKRYPKNDGLGLDYIDIDRVSQNIGNRS